METTFAPEGVSIDDARAAAPSTPLPLSTVTVAPEIDAPDEADDESASDMSCWMTYSELSVPSVTLPSLVVSASLGRGESP